MTPSRSHETNGAASILIKFPLRLVDDKDPPTSVPRIVNVKQFMKRIQ